MQTFLDYINEAVTEQEDKLYNYIIQDMKKNGYDHVNADDYIYDTKLQKLIFTDAIRGKDVKISKMIHSMVQKKKFEIVKKSESRSSDTTYSQFGHYKTGTVQTASTSFIIKPIGN